MLIFLYLPMRRCEVLQWRLEIMIRYDPLLLVQYICIDTGVSAANSGFHDSSVEWLQLAMHKYSEARQVQVKPVI